MRILVATDLTERSDRALERAVMLARGLTGTLAAIHVVDGELPRKLVRDTSNDALETLSAHVAHVAAEIPTTIEVRSGTPWIEVVRFAKSWRADLLVLGVPRQAALRDLFQGTTAERIIRNSDTPVLVVRRKPVDQYRELIAGVDFSIQSRRAVEFAARLAPHSRLHLVHAFEIPFAGFLSERERTSPEVQQQFDKALGAEMKPLLRRLAKKAPRLRITLSIVQGGPVQVLSREVSKARSGLLVLGAHGRSGLALAFLGSTTVGVLSHPSADVLALKVKSR